MFHFNYSVFCIFSLVFVSVKSQYGDYLSNYLYIQPYQQQILPAADLYLIKDKLQFRQEKVKVQLYYECLCPDCRSFDTSQFAPTVKKLGDHLDIHIYPYGNAYTTTLPNGMILITCQHGPAECYGNMLHACAIDQLNNMTLAVEFNSCMMDDGQKNGGSNDEAADKCGKVMNINSEPIKQCANSPRGQDLLKYYGEESKKVGFTGVPYMLINGVQNDGDDYFHAVCAAFKKPPPACSKSII